LKVKIRIQKFIIDFQEFASVPGACWKRLYVLHPLKKSFSHLVIVEQANSKIFPVSDLSGAA
jgi:hypothetical protein